MKTKKILALAVVLAMVFSLTACAQLPVDPSDIISHIQGLLRPAEPTEPPVEPTEPPVEQLPNIEDGDVSISFDDGNFGFAAIYDGRANADASEMEIVEVRGNNALKITNKSGKVPYVAFDLLSLLGENAGNVATIELLIGTENPDGEFYACSGNLMVWTGDKLSKTTYGWSVYLASKNPKVATFALEDYELISETNPVVVLTLDTDNGASAGAANANMLIYSMTFRDASGNILAADSAAAFVAPEGFASDKDMSNLKYLKNTVSFDAMTGVSGGAWSQGGIEMPEEFLAALVPGSVIEIEYTTTSATGDLWIVMPWATNGWMRVCMQVATKNNSLNICQITYEEIAAVCGENVADWGAMFQCESDGDWQVYSVKVGMDSGLVATSGHSAIDGAACTGGAWSQNGPTLTEEQLALFKPGTILEISYTSTSGDLWIVLPDSSSGWMRIEQQTAACNGATCQITYEQIAAVCGEDVSQWGTRLQFESSGDWEVFAASVCKPALNVSGLVDLGVSCTGTAWGQNGFEMTEDQKALLVPGSAFIISYTSTSATGDLWIVMPDAGCGWSRVEQQSAECDGETCIITFEQIAAVCGEDVSQWFTNGNRVQFESDGDWEVFAVSVGAVKSNDSETPDDGGETPDDGGETPEISIPDVPAGDTLIYSGTTASSGWSFTSVNTTVWGGTVDPSAFTGGHFSVYFTGENVYSVHFAVNGNQWAQVDVSDLSGATELSDGTRMITVSVADLATVYGADLTGIGQLGFYVNEGTPTLVTFTPAA